LNSLEGREKRGLFLASQIIQRYSGSLDLQMTPQGQFLGIRIKIPFHSPSISQQKISTAPVSAIQMQGH
jgi:hypothetical protein